MPARQPQGQRFQGAGSPVFIRGYPCYPWFLPCVHGCCISGPGSVSQKAMKKLRVTVDGEVFEVIVEEFEQGGQSSVPSVPSVTPVGGASVPAANVAPPVSAPPSKPAASPVGAGAMACPLSGRVVSIDCVLGQAVNEGDQLVTLEAMKMNTMVFAQGAGTVKEILVAAGDAVEEGQALVVIQ